MEEIRIDEIKIPSQIEIRMKDVVNRIDYKNIELDENNVIIAGFETYLNAIINDQVVIKFTRRKKLQKINIGLASAA